MNNLEIFNKFLRENNAFSEYHFNLKLEKGHFKATEFLEVIKVNPKKALTYAFGFKVVKIGGKGSCALWEALDLAWRLKVDQCLGKKS